MTEQHVTDISRKVKVLKKLERVPTNLAAQCCGNAAPTARSWMLGATATLGFNEL